MQTSMGQTATTLTGLLEMYDDQVDGDSEELVETQLLQARKKLIEAVRTAGDCTAPLNRLLELKCPISMKYAQLNVRQLLKDNNESVGQLKAIPAALGMLEKYGRHLLKPPGARVDMWRQIKFSNPIFKDRVLPMQGALEVVKQMGYSAPVDCGLQFAADEPDPVSTINLVADIILARTEMERYLMNKHPHPETIHALLPESTIDQLLLHWEQVLGAEAGTISINPPAPSLTPQQVFHPPTPVSASVEEQAGSSCGAQLSEPQASQMGEMEDQQSFPLHLQDDSLQRACDICGEVAATCWCQLCDNKQLCDACDDMWHRHPKRQNHQRDPIASLPNPSTVAPSDNIMGPFGIRAVHSMSTSGRDSERSPTPVSGTPSAGNHRESNSRTPPPQQRQPTPPPQTVQTQQQQDVLTQQQQQAPPTSAQDSLLQHQQQLQFYQQQQQLLQQQQQQQQFFQQQQWQGLSAMGDCQTLQPPFLCSTGGSTLSSPLQENFAAQAVQSQPRNESLLATVPRHSPSYPPFPALDPSPSSQLRYGEDAGAIPPSASVDQRRSAHIPQPDHSLRIGQQSVVPGAVGGATSAGYADWSRRQPPRGESVKAFGAAPVTESSMFGPASEQRNSGSAPWKVSAVSPGAALMSESVLLKPVLAESDFEKRAAKCDIRLLTLDEELQEVEGRLNNLMLNSDDFTMSDDFTKLNRSKAVLMKERQALSNYRQELADLMAVEPPRTSYPPSDQDHLPQIFHPPPLSSSPSFPSPHTPPYPPAPSPPQPQPGFSYPHQASQSPVYTQDRVPASAYQQQSHLPPHRGVCGNRPQSDVGYHFSSRQESMTQNATANSNSSVDRSSILSQWQMLSNVSTASSGAGVNQPPPYQHGEVSSSPGQQGFASPAITSSTGLPQFSASGQGRPVPSGAQEHGMPNSVGHFSQNYIAKGFLEKSQHGFNRPCSAPTLHASSQPVTQGGGSIGFENMAAQESSLAHQQSSPPGRLPQPQSQQVPRPSAPLTPSPPPARPTPLVSQQLGKFDVPEQQWQCCHCTYINDPGTRVCMVCDRTSDNPTLVHSDRGVGDCFGEMLITFGESAQEPTAPLLAGAEASGFAVAAVEPSSANNEHLAKIHSRIAEEQDQIYLEKKEAHEQFRRANLDQSQTVKASASPANQPLPRPPTKTSPPPRPPLPSKRPTSTSANEKQPSERDLISLQSKGSDKPTTVKQEAVKHAPQEPEAQGEVMGSGGSGGGGDSGGIGSLDSALISMEDEDFSMTMERFSEQRRIKQQQLDGADLMHFIKMADRQGFQVEEMQAALVRCQERYTEALNWLSSEWGKLVQVVVSSTRSEGQRLDQNDIGELSEEEARKALRESLGDMVAAVKSCVAKRKQLYANLNPSGTFAREEVLQAMLQSCGDEDSAREQLHAAVLQPFLDRVWQGENKEGAGAGEREGTTASRTLLQMSMAEAACQSIATSIINHADFQQMVMDKAVDRDRRVRMILVEGKLQSWGRADMVIKLLDVDLPASYQSASLAQGEELPYTLEDVVEAARNCRDRQSARVYLTQECSTCLALYPMSKIRNLNFCQCKICTDCLKQNFEVVIREKHVRHWTCPICSLPDLNDTETSFEYLGFLGMMLQTLVDKEVYTLFDIKMRDWHLQKDPNFRWCAHCGNGFIADERRLCMVCPQCGDKTCYSCKRQWEDQHEGLTCSQFAQWKIDNDPTNQAVGLARHLEENGIDCPSCKMRYALAKGGCMHFKCPQCGHEFCSGCYMPFYQRGTCPNRQKSCKNSGLHAHHPRDCFFYLRDEDVDRLQSLLKEANVLFNTIPPDSQEDASHCPVIEQKEFDSGKSDESCGKDSPEGYAGLCVTHYKEYLVGLINKNHIDPVIVMTLDDLKKLLKRGEIVYPKRSSHESDVNYRKRLIKFVKDKIPLPKRGP